MRIISFPFRLTANGDLASVEQNSAQGAAEQIAMLIQTEIGERVMLPSFGVTDMTFHRPDEGEIALGVALYGPQVTVTSVTSYYQSDDTLIVGLEFTDGS